MKIGEILYFAPNIRFGEVNLNDRRLPSISNAVLRGSILSQQSNARSAATPSQPAFFW